MLYFAALMRFPVIPKCDLAAGNTAAASRISPYGCAMKQSVPTLRTFQKVSEESGVWPGRVRIGPKAWENLVGMEKGLWGSKGWEAKQ